MDQNDTQQAADLIEPAAAPVTEASAPAADIAAPAADPAEAENTKDEHPAHSVLNEIEDKLEMWCDDVEGEFSHLLTKLRELL